MVYVRLYAEIVCMGVLNSTPAVTSAHILAPTIIPIIECGGKPKVTSLNLVLRKQGTYRAVLVLRTE
jgi:hypothetical protein